MTKIAKHIALAAAGIAMGSTESKVNPRKKGHYPDVRQMSITAAFAVGGLFVLTALERRFGMIEN